MLSKMGGHDETAVTEVTRQVSPNLGEVTVPDVDVGARAAQELVTVDAAGALGFKGGLSKQLVMKYFTFIPSVQEEVTHFIYVISCEKKMGHYFLDRWYE